MSTIVQRVGLGAVGALLALGVVTGVATGTAQAAPSAPIPQMRSDIMDPGRMFGDPAAAATFWQRQSLDDCALMAAADVIGELTGHEPTEQDIIAVAQRLPSQSHTGPIYTLPADVNDPDHTGRGTDPNDLPVLLARYGITSVTTEADDASVTAPTAMEQLEQYLARGRKVIVGVNAELIWGDPIETKDREGDPVADHALVLTGVDTANGKVHLNDSGIDGGRDETVSLDLFVKAWATSGNQMTVAEEAR
jgi:Peptidase_C39 like family